MPEKKRYFVYSKTVDGYTYWRLYSLKPGVTEEEWADSLAKRPTMKMCETERPDFETLEEWDMDGVAEATDGCRVEPDGVCEHGHPSWLLALGMI